MSLPTNGELTAAYAPENLRALNGPLSWDDLRFVISNHFFIENPSGETVTKLNPEKVEALPKPFKDFVEGLYTNGQQDLIRGIALRSLDEALAIASMPPQEENALAEHIALVEARLQPYNLVLKMKDLGDAEHATATTLIKGAIAGLSADEGSLKIAPEKILADLRDLLVEFSLRVALDQKLDGAERLASFVTAVDSIDLLPETSVEIARRLKDHSDGEDSVKERYLLIAMATYLGSKYAGTKPAVKEFRPLDKLIGNILNGRFRAYLE